jgi:hypothetical protein
LSSEHPFGAPDVVTTVREYDREGGHPARKLYCVIEDEVVAFDFAKAKSLGAVVTCLTSMARP